MGCARGQNIWMSTMKKDKSNYGIMSLLSYPKLIILCYFSTGETHIICFRHFPHWKLSLTLRNIYFWHSEIEMWDAPLLHLGLFCLSYNKLWWKKKMAQVLFRYIDAILLHLVYIKHWSFPWWDEEWLRVCSFVFPFRLQAKALQSRSLLVRYHWQYRDGFLKSLWINS